MNLPSGLGNFIQNNNPAFSFSGQENGGQKLTSFQRRQMEK